MPDLDQLKADFVDAGIWVRPFNNVIYCMPPYVIDRADLDRLVTTMIDVTRRWATSRF